MKDYIQTIWDNQDKYANRKLNQKFATLQAERNDLFKQGEGVVVKH